MKYNQQIEELTEYFKVLKALGQPVDLHTYTVSFDHRVVSNVRKALLKDFSIDTVWKSTLLEFFTMLENSLGDQIFKLHSYCSVYATPSNYTTGSTYSLVTVHNTLTVGMVISLHRLITRT